MMKSSKVFLIHYLVVILVGDASVGKTNIVSRIVKSNEGIGQKNIAPTIGVEFASKLKKLSDGKIIKCQIWDTGNSYLISSRTIAISCDYYGVKIFLKSKSLSKGSWRSCCL